MSELNSQLQQLCFYTYHLTRTESPHLLSSESDLTRSSSPVVCSFELAGSWVGARWLVEVSLFAERAATFIAQPRTSSQELPCVKIHVSPCACGDWHQLHDWLDHTSIRPDLCRKRPLVSRILNPSITRTSAATIKFASPQNPIFESCEQVVYGVQWSTRQFPQSRHVDIRVLRLSKKANERVSCAHRQRDSQCTMRLKYAPSCRKWLPFLSNVK